MTRRLNSAGLDLLKTWEQGPGGGPALTPYLDAVGKPTIGYGHVVRPGESFLRGLSLEGAEDLLAADVAWAEECVADRVTVPLTDNQFAALVCLAFNIGPQAFADSTLVKTLNGGGYPAVPYEMSRWNKGGGRVIAGLVNRRNAEIALWMA